MIHKSLGARTIYHFLTLESIDIGDQFQFLYLQRLPISIQGMVGLKGQHTNLIYG